MSIKKQIVVTDWTKNKTKEGDFLKLTLNSDQRRILRGKKISDCNQVVLLQLPRGGKLSDGDVLLTNYDQLFVKIIAQKEKLLEISSKSKLELIKVAYHLGNRHLEIEIYKDILLAKKNYIIEDLLKNFNVNFIETEKKFFPETGAFNHD